MSYFYCCPECRYYALEKEIPRRHKINLRDGYGRPIYHYNCPKCGNANAGAINISGWEEDRDVFRYVREVVDFYNRNN